MEFHTFFVCSVPADRGLKPPDLPAPPEDRRIHPGADLIRRFGRGPMVDKKGRVEALEGRRSPRQHGRESTHGARGNNEGPLSAKPLARYCLTLPCEPLRSHICLIERWGIIRTQCCSSASGGG